MLFVTESVLPTIRFAAAAGGLRANGQTLEVYFVSGNRRDIHVNSNGHLSSCLTAARSSLPIPFSLRSSRMRWTRQVGEPHVREPSQRVGHRRRYQVLFEQMQEMQARRWTRLFWSFSHHLINMEYQLVRFSDVGMRSPRPQPETLETHTPRLYSPIPPGTDRLCWMSWTSLRRPRARKLSGLF